MLFRKWTYNCERCDIEQHLPIQAHKFFPLNSLSLSAYLTAISRFERVYACICFPFSTATQRREGAKNAKTLIQVFVVRCFCRLRFVCAYIAKFEMFSSEFAQRIIMARCFYAWYCFVTQIFVFKRNKTTKMTFVNQIRSIRMPYELSWTEIEYKQ